MSAESWAYSDSINDRFLLEYADHAIAVNPDDRLEALAKEQALGNSRLVDFSICLSLFKKAALGQSSLFERDKIVGL